MYREALLCAAALAAMGGGLAAQSTPLKAKVAPAPVIKVKQAQPKVQVLRSADSLVVLDAQGQAQKFAFKSGGAGISVSSSATPRDTLGLLVTAVAAGSAGERAGIAEGNRIATVNGVNLKLHPEDANQSDMQGIMARRFQREMGKLRPGDSVRLNVYADARYRDVVVRLEPLTARRNLVVAGADMEKAAIGAVLSVNASKRDTLGVLVVEIAENGPLAKSGIYEGSRIAAIGSVDLRVPAATAGDAKATQEKADLLAAEVAKVTPGTRVELRVYEGGRFRNVTVETMRRGDVNLPFGLRAIIRGGDNSLMLREFRTPDGRIRVLPEGVDSLVQQLNRHVLPGLHVDESARLQVERVMDELGQRLRHHVFPGQITVNRLGVRTSE